MEPISFLMGVSLTILIAIALGTVLWMNAGAILNAVISTLSSRTFYLRITALAIYGVHTHFVAALSIRLGKIVFIHYGALYGHLIILPYLIVSGYYVIKKSFIDPL